MSDRLGGKNEEKNCLYQLVLFYGLTDIYSTETLIHAL